MNGERMRDVIDDYTSSIHTIIGFMNFYVYDDTAKQNRRDVRVFQGRELYRLVATESDLEEPVTEAALEGHADSTPQSTTVEVADVGEPLNASTTTRPDITNQEMRPVTPDFGIVHPDQAGVVGEVKLSFPKDRNLWMQDFEQLKRYDAELVNWPTDDGQVREHQIVCITHQSRAVAVKDYYLARVAEGVLSFVRPFAIVQCGRLEQRRQFYFFQVVEGALSDEPLQERLHEGVQVPMEVLVGKYSTVKFYDAEPPMPYLMQVIWEHVVLPKVRSLSKFSTLRRKQRLEAIIEVSEIVDILVNQFSFRTFPNITIEGQPDVPHRNWVERACEQFVSANDAEWVDATKNSIRFFFQRYSSVLDHFIDVCTKPLELMAEKDPQMKLFDA